MLTDKRKAATSTFTARESHGSRQTVILLDASSSMIHDDLKPSRFEAAAEGARELCRVKARQYPEDQVALVQFACKARVLKVLGRVTADLSEIDQALYEYSPIGATNITAGLQLAGKILGGHKPGRFLLSKMSELLWDQPSSSGTTTPRASEIILLADGGHCLGPYPDAVATKLKASGVCIHVIGIGLEGEDSFNEPLLINLASRDGQGRPCYRRIHDTQTVVEHFENLAHHIKPLSTF